MQRAEVLQVIFSLMIVISMALRCPKCGYELERIHAVMSWHEIKGWKCKFCDDFYTTKKLEKIVFAV